MNKATWRGVPDARHRGPEWFQWPRVIWRALALLLVTLLLLPPYLLLRLVDMAMPQRHRAHIVARAWARAGLFLVGIRLRLAPQVRQNAEALVANHSSWLDIWVLHCLSPAYFVAKSEVGTWPGIGQLARLSGAEFIERNSRAAATQSDRLRRRLALGHALCFFPEGTSSDGLRVLPFKPTLFAALMTAGQDRQIRVQPVSVIYRTGPGLPADFYGLWGSMNLLRHLTAVLARSRHGTVELQLHDQIRTTDFADRKALALHCETVIRDGMAAVEDAI